MSDTVGNVARIFVGSALIAAGAIAAIPTFGVGAVPLIGAGIGLVSSGIKGFIRGRPSRSDAQQAHFDPQASHKVVYGGPVRLGVVGADIWVDDDDISDRESLWTFVTFCIGSENGSGVEAVEKLWIDDILAVDPVSTGGTTNVTTNKTSWFSGSDILTYNVRRGTDAQGVNTDAQAAASNASDRYPDSFDFTGLCYAALNLWKDKKKFPNFPRAISATIKGNRVYDPRHPSGGPANDGWVWDAADSAASENPGQNPALILLDYLTSDRYGAEFFYPERDGGDTSLSQIDEQSFIDGANICDEQVQDGSGGTQARFKFNDWLDTGNSLQDNINAILSSMRGQLIYQEGKFRLVIPQTQNSVMTLDEDDIIGDWSFSRAGSTKVPNRVVVKVPGGENGEKTEEIQFPAEDDTTFLDQDGGNPQVRTIELHGVENKVRAEQIAMVSLREARKDAGVQFTATERAAELEVGDVFTLDHATPGWTGTSAKDVRVVQLQMLPDFTVRITAKEYADSIYSLDPQTAPTPPPGSNLPDPTSTGAPTGLTLTSDSTTQQITPAGDKIPRILATWTLPTDEGIDRVVVLERESGTSSWNTADVVDPSDEQRALFEPRGGEDGETWEVGLYVIVGQRQRKSAITTATVTLDTDFVASDILGSLIAEDTEESDFDSDGVVEGRLTIEVIADSGSYDIDFYNRQGRGAFPGTPTASVTGLSSGQTATQDVELIEGKLGFIRYDVFEAGTTNLLGRSVVAFDPDAVAGVQNLGAWIQDDGTPGADAGGDSDTATIHLTFTTDNTEPTDPTATNADATINAREGSVTFASTVPKGNLLRVKARGENAAGDLAPAATIKSDQQVRPGGDTGVLVTPTPTADPLRTTNPVAQDVTLDAAAGPLGTTSLEVNHKVVEAKTGRTILGWQGWVAAPTTVTITRGAFLGRELVYKARDTGVQDNPESGEQTLGIDPFLDLPDMPGLGRGPFEDDRFRDGLGGEPPGSGRSTAPVWNPGRDTRHLDPRGQLENTTLQGSNFAKSGLSMSDGARSGPIQKINEDGKQADNDSVTFGSSYQNTPQLHMLAGWKSRDPSLKETLGTVPDVKATNTSPSGFDQVARLKEDDVTISAQQVSFASDTIDAIGIDDRDFSADKEDATDSSNAWNDEYTFNFDISANSEVVTDGFQGDCDIGSITVGGYSNDGSGFVQRFTETQEGADCSDTSRTGVERSFAVSAIGTHTGKEFAMAVESEDSPGGSYTANHAAWETATEPDSVDATDGGTFPVAWVGYAKSDA